MNFFFWFRFIIQDSGFRFQNYQRDIRGAEGVWHWEGHDRRVERGVEKVEKVEKVGGARNGRRDLQQRQQTLGSVEAEL